MSLLIKNGQAMVKGKLVACDIFCDKGKILEIGTLKNKKADEVIDASEKIILPGIIDCHVHFREPGQSHKEDFLTGSRAAAAGGVTTILAMPNTQPPILTLETLEQERALAKKSVVNYGCYLCGADNVGEIKKAKNIPGVKLYLDVTTGNMKIDNPELINKIFSSHKRIAVHAEGQKVKECISRIKKTKNALYLCHISSKEEIETIRKEKDRRIFCEVTPHHLFLTKEDAKRLGPFGLMKPELKSKTDVEALWKGIADGTVDTVCTDHAPHTIEEKNSEKPPWGVPGVQTMLPLLLDAVNSGKLPLEKIPVLCSENPAKIFGIKGKGKIEKGYDADLVIVDMNLEKEVRNQDMLSRCGWTPFDKKVLKGWPVITIVNGNVTYDGAVHEEHRGKEVKFT
ncbi:MAG: amidohydrolase family protein [Nanoarchaeota archaeon]|nr:amidohydrolase family protein [Nanoarchaeota archaeon]